MKTINIRITFTEDLLGTLPGNKEVYEEYVASKAPAPETASVEVGDYDVDEEIVKGMTVFARDGQDRPFLYDYVIKGFFKDACSMLRRVDGTKSKRLTAHKKLIDGLVFPSPRKIALVLPEGGKIAPCSRPLRADTAQGPRVALASSESAPAGTMIDFAVMLLDDSLEPVVTEWLDYGALRGIGGWRNSGTGRFTYEVLPA